MGYILNNAVDEDGATVDFCFPSVIGLFYTIERSKETVLGYPTRIFRVYNSLGTLLATKSVTAMAEVREGLDPRIGAMNKQEALVWESTFRGAFGV